MRNDLVRLLIVIWMAAMAYFIYSIWYDLGYMTDLVHAYIKMAVENIRN